MTISKDLRTRVLKFIQAGGRKTEASKRFSVSRTAIYQWLSGKLPNETGVKFRRNRKLNRAALKKHVQRYPDALLRERAGHFDVCINAVWYALREMKLTYKKSFKIQ